MAATAGEFRVDRMASPWRCPCGNPGAVRIWVTTDEGDDMKVLCPACGGRLAAEILNALMDNPLRLGRLETVSGGETPTCPG